MALVQEFARARMLHESFGVAPYGADLRQWPALVVDAFVILQQEHNKVETLSRISDTPQKKRTVNR